MYNFNKIIRKKIPIALLLILCFCAMIFLSSLSIGESMASTSARAMCVMEKTTGRVLDSYNMKAKLPMASTTKVVTAITVIENTKDVNKIYKVPAQAVGIEGSSIYLECDEELKVIDLLYGLMLQSGNDCAVALAIITSGSVEKFAELMSETAKKIGANDSNFTNPHGLHDDKHYTTAYDLSLISCYAMRNPLFKEIVGTKSYRTTWKDREYGRVINNKNKILNNYEGGTGVKTGFTKKAGRCLVSASERAGMEVIAVVLNCGEMFEECMRLMDAAHAKYTMTGLVERGERLGEVEVSKSRTAKVAFGVPKSPLYPLSDGEINKITYKFSSTKTLSAPVRIGDEAGNMEIYLDNQLLFTKKIYTIEEAKSLTIKERLEDIIGEWIS